MKNSSDTFFSDSNSQINIFGYMMKLLMWYAIKAWLPMRDKTQNGSYQKPNNKRKPSCHQEYIKIYS